jgi:hypothetical protein
LVAVTECRRVRSFTERLAVVAGVDHERYFEQIALSQSVDGGQKALLRGGDALCIEDRQLFKGGSLSQKVTVG